MASKKPHDSARKAQLRPAQALRFRIESSGELRAAVSASSGEFSLTPEIIELLCLIQKGTHERELAGQLRSRFRQLLEQLPDQKEISALINDLEEAQCLVGGSSESTPHGLGDGFGDSWIQWAMLADAPRCIAYQRAISAKVSNNAHVVDVGAGSGLLSVYALKAGAKRVDAIEETAVAKSLKQVRDKLPESFRKRLQIQNCNSYDAKLSPQITHVVSELFGNDPLQEGVVPTLRNIFARLEQQQIAGIPENCTVYIQLVDVVAGSLHKRLQRFADNSTEKNKDWFESIELIKETLDFRDVSFAHMIRVEDYRQISDLKKTFTLPLAPPPPEAATRPTSVLKVQVERMVSAPAFLVTFRAQLSPGISISNIPGEKDSCEHWSPIIVPISRPLQKNETLQVNVSIAEHWDRLTIVATDSSGKNLGSRS